MLTNNFGKKKIAALVLGAALMTAGSISTYAHTSDAGKVSSIDESKSLVAAREMYEIEKEWSELLNDFRDIMELESDDDSDEAKMLWMALLSDVDEKLGVDYDTADYEWDWDWDWDATGLEGWNGYIKCFGDLLDASYSDELIELAEKLDALSEDDERRSVMEAEMDALIEKALGDTELWELGEAFPSVELLSGALDEEALKAYEELLNEYNMNEYGGNFVEAQEAYQALIDMLNGYAEMEEYSGFDELSLSVPRTSEDA